MWGTYSCSGPHSTKDQEIILWGRNGSFGIDTTAKVWTVKESLDGGQSGRTHTVQVRAAFFVGNAA